jgi:hypothetical protein
MPKNSNAQRAKRREDRLKHEKQAQLAKIAADKEQAMQKMLSVFDVLEGAHQYIKNKSKVLASGILGFLPYHDINALAGTCTQLRNHIHQSGVLDQPNHVKTWLDMHVKHFEARDKKYGLPDEWSRNWECRDCGCNAHCDVVGDLTCFCDTCKGIGCEMMWVECEASKLERRMGLGNYPSCYDSDGDGSYLGDYPRGYRRGHRRGYSSGYHSSDSDGSFNSDTDGDEGNDQAKQQQIMEQVVNQQLTIVQQTSAW